MKAFYSILLLISLVLYTEAQTDSTSFISVNSLFVNPSDRDFLTNSDSLGTSNIESIHNSIPKIISEKSTKTLLGTASYYSAKFEGKKTATGEVFHQRNLTCASNNFKLNTWLRVTNLKNGESVIVRITDRMHPSMAKKGRVADLTTTAAKKIGITSKIGLAKVKVEQVSKRTVE